MNRDIDLDWTETVMKARLSETNWSVDKFDDLGTDWALVISISLDEFITGSSPATLRAEN